MIILNTVYTARILDLRLLRLNSVVLSQEISPDMAEFRFLVHSGSLDTKINFLPLEMNA